MDKKFVNGLFVDEKTTQFGKIQKLNFQVEKFKQFLDENKNENGYVNIDLLSNKDGKKYAVLNDFKPQRNDNNVNNQEEQDILPF